MNRAEKLKLFYVCCMLVFFVVNAHVEAWAVNKLRFIGSTIYTGWSTAGDEFLFAVIFTMIVGIANIFLLKKVNRENARMFLFMMLTDTAFLAARVITMVFIHHLKGSASLPYTQLQNDGLLFLFFSIKTMFIIKWFNASKRDIQLTDLPQ